MQIEPHGPDSGAKTPLARAWNNRAAHVKILPVAQAMRNDETKKDGWKQMKKTLIFAYGVVSYLVFFGTFLYAIGFIGNFGVPKTMDSPAEGSFRAALLIDSLLLAAFALQHSIMARPGFKRILTRYIPQAAERSTYVLASSLALILLFWQWRPLGGVIWNAESTTARVLLYGGYAFGDRKSTRLNSSHT